MRTYPDLVQQIQEQHARDLERARLARIAACARACCAVPTTILDRLVRVLRPAPRPC
jgi:hypothetical protein